MKKRNFKDKLGYWFDRVMTKGPIAMSLLLFAVTILVVGVVGIAASFVAEDRNIIHQLWHSLLHTLDTGTLGEDATQGFWYTFFMFLATLCGLCLTSVLISIVSTGVENKLRELRKGTSVVQEENHTVVVGFDDNVYTLLDELILANENKKNACIVVLGEQPKEEMEDAITAHIPNTKTTHIICRSGKLHEPHSLHLCAVERAKSVIVNERDDADTVKVLLALATYLKDKDLLHPDLNLVAYLQESQYIETAFAAAEGRAKIVCIKDAISRIIANTCRQHGLSQVITELLNFSGDELYIEYVPALTGKTVREALFCFSNAVVVGLCVDGKTCLNPSMDTVIGEKDGVVLLEEDDGAYEYHEPRAADITHIAEGERAAARSSDHLIVLGSNNKLPGILAEYDRYVPPHTRVTVVDNELSESGLGEYENLEISVCSEKINRRLLTRFVESNHSNLLLLNDDSLEPEASDSQTLLRLILLRDIADKLDKPFTITTEMCNADNQRLASQARVDDFVIGTDFISRLMAQIAEDPRIKPLIDDLLDEDGSELYLKPIGDYVAVGQEVDGYVLTESAARRGEVFIGYRRFEGDRTAILNPCKDEKIVFDERDFIAVIAEN